MPITPPSMSISTWNTLSTSALPTWYNARKARDVVSKGSPVLHYMLAKAKRQELGRTIAVRLLDTLNLPEAYSYYGTVNTAPVRTTTAGEDTVAMYSVPISISEQELLELDVNKIAEAMEFKIYQAERGYAKRLAIDVYAGAVSNSERLRGLEEIAYMRNQSAGAGITLTSDVWKLRQANNTYAGITRSAFTADETGGTGWENVSTNFNELTPIQYSSAAPYGPDTGLKALTMLFNAATYGMDAPDLIAMHPKAYDDYEFAAQAKQLVYKMTDELTGAELSFGAMMFKGRPMFRDEFCKVYNTVASHSTAGLGAIYFLNSEVLKLVVDPRKEFTLSSPKETQAQFASVSFIQFRGQQICESPRQLAVGFNYAV